MFKILILYLFRREDKENLESVSCAEYGQIFNDEDLLNRCTHRTHDFRVGYNEFRFGSLCPLCEELFQRTAELDDHIKSTHELQLATETTVFNSDEGTVLFFHSCCIQNHPS